LALASEREIQQAYRDRSVAAGYLQERFASELNALLHEKQVAGLRSLLTRTRARRVLELAPGPGRVTKDIQGLRSLVCLEYSAEMIKLGRIKCGPSISWIRGNGFHLPFRHAFDLVYSFRFVRHFHREDRKRLYAEIHAVLKPGGYFVMDAVNRRVSKPLRDAHPERYVIYDKLYRQSDLRKELVDAGLRPLDVVPVQKFYRLQYLSQIVLGPRANWLNRLLVHGLERLPATDGLEWVVTCRRA
jgi:SAM-dependent methyltransferase